jgi:hypothetical protein
MNNELDRIKNDVEIIQQAMGLPVSFKEEWVQWMKRDSWFSLWWCVPGLILIVAALLPLDHAHRYLGLVPDQWAGILVAVALLGIAKGHTRQITGQDGRPEEMVRENKRLYGVNSQLRFVLASLVQIVV